MKMKYFFAMIAAALVMTNCSQDEEFANRNQSKEGIRQLTATIEGGSRSVVSDAGVFSWSKGDEIAVYNGDESDPVEFIYGDDGKFSTEATVGTLSECAIYPAGNWKSKNAITMPASYGSANAVYTPNTNAPMYAVVNESQPESLNFKHLGGVMRFIVKDVPVGANQFVFTATGKAITGDFTLAEEDGEKVIKTSDGTNNTVTITFKALTVPQDMTFFVPLPVGTYSGCTVAIKDGSSMDLSLNSNATNIIKRRSLLLMPTLTCTDTNLIKEDGNTVVLENTDQSMAVSGNDEEVVVEVPANVDATATLNLNYTPEDNSTSQLTISDGKSGASTASEAKVVLTVPADKTVADLNITTPTLTVELASGTYTTVDALTATETLIIKRGVKIGTLNVSGGKVVIEDGATITTNNYQEPTTSEITTLDQLKTAFQNGGTYKLGSIINNVTEDLVVGEDVSLDLRTNSIYLGEKSIKVASGKSLTIITSGNEGQRAITSSGDVIVAGENSAIHIGAGVNLESSANCCIFVPKDANGVTIETAGNLSATGGNYAALQVNGYVTSGTIHVTGGSITHASNTAIYAAGQVDLTIEANTTIEGTTGVEIRAGHLTVNGGEIKGNGNPFDADPNGNGSTSVGAAVAVCQHTTNYPLYATINGGTFTGIRALYEEDLQDETATDKIAMMVNGGTFAGEVKSENCQAFIHGGTFTDASVFSYLADRADIVLGGDMTLSAPLTIAAGKTVILDLNGKTISQEYAQTNAYSMLVNKGTLSIMDSATGGKISYKDSGNGGEYVSNTISNHGILSINDVTIENISSSTVATNGYPHAIDNFTGGEVLIQSGTVYCAEYSAIRLFCNNLTSDNKVAISGGTIKGAVDLQNASKDNACKGSLVITGGIFEKTKSSSNIRIADWHYYGSSATISGVSASISGGTFDAGIYKNIDTVQNFITGGTFGADVSAYVANGYTATESDGKWIVIQNQ